MKGIYKIVNKINNKIYIGSSKNFDSRFYNHVRSLRYGNHYNKYLQRAWNKYDENNFVFKLLLICEEFELLRYEQWFIDTLNPQYNTSMVASGGDYWTGRTHTKETKQKIGNTNRGKLSGKNNPMFGVAHTEEAKKKISIANSGEGCAHSKLTKHDVIKIRELYNEEGLLQRELARLYNVSCSTISSVITYTTWKIL